MGRHSSPEQWAFYRSLLGWLLPWLLVAGVVGAAVWVAVSTVGGEHVRSPVLSHSRSPSPQQTASAAARAPRPRKPKTASPEPTSPSPSAQLITSGITVQVLNASGVTGADQVMADRLSALGFRIVAQVQAARLYGHTTVYWSSDATRPAAEALAERFGWRSAPKPSNLSPDVSVHVVVGKDEGAG